MKLISKFFFLFMSVFLVSYIVYIRLILVRLPRELMCTSKTLPYYLISFCIFFFIFILKIYLHAFSDVPKEGSWSQKIKDTLHFDHSYDYYATQLKKYHQYLVDKYDLMDDMFNVLLKLILKHHLILRSMYFGLTYGPRYLVSILFLIESVFFHRLNLFYSCLPILFVPLLCQYILFALKNFVETNIEYLNNSVEIDVILSETENYKVNAQIYNDFMLTAPPGTEFNAFITFNETSQEYLKKQGRDVLEETKVISAFLYSLVNFNHLSIYLNKLKQEYNIYFQLGSIVIYMLSWLYIIFFTGESWYGLTELIKLITLILIFASKEEPFSGIYIN